jgi:hypothetical protein
LRFSRWWLWRMASSEMLRRAALVRTEVLDDLSASSVRVIRISVLGATLGATSNQRTDRQSNRAIRLCTQPPKSRHLHYWDFNMSEFHITALMITRELHWCVNNWPKYTDLQLVGNICQRVNMLPVQYPCFRRATENCDKATTQIIPLRRLCWRNKVINILKYYCRRSKQPLL